MASVMAGIPDVDGLALKPSRVMLVRGKTQDQLDTALGYLAFLRLGNLVADPAHYLDYSLYNRRFRIYAEMIPPSPFSIKSHSHIGHR